MIKPSQHRRALQLFLAFSIGMSLAIVVFNYLMDPFDIHQSTKYAGFNAVKTEIENQQRLYKSVSIARQKPQALILGSSRVIGGLDPNELTHLTGYKAYNGGVADASFEEIYHFFDHALYHQPDLRIVVIGIDLFAFNKHKALKPDFSLERLKCEGLCTKDLTNSLFTQLALSCSWETLKKNASSQAPVCFYENGFYDPSQFQSDKNELFNREVYDYVKIMFASSNVYRGFELDPYKVELFKKLVQTCQDKGIVLKTYMSPTQVYYWEGLRQGQMWDTLDQFKRELASLHPLWDFSGANAITTQTYVPPKGEVLYYECNHFSPVVGKMALEVMFKTEEQPLDFGLYLTAETVDAQLREVAQKQKHWADTHPQEVEKVRQALISVHAPLLQAKERTDDAI